MSLTHKIKARMDKGPKPQRRKDLGPDIEVTLVPHQGIQEARVKINHLTILAYNDTYDYVETANGFKRVFVGCSIASKNHFGWLVKENEATVQRLIENVATKEYINPGKLAQG